MSQFTWAVERSLGIIAYSINTAVVFSRGTLVNIYNENIPALIFGYGYRTIQL